MLGPLVTPCLTFELLPDCESGCAVTRSHQQCVRALMSLHPRQYFFVFHFSHPSIREAIAHDFDLYSLRIDDIDNLLMCSWAHVSLLWRRLLLSYKSSLYILTKAFIIICKYYLPLSGFSEQVHCNNLSYLHRTYSLCAAS